ncbi:unnamed protein product [Parnassius mnemosyne]|uniref:Transposase Tc1-like domain-containing protein n=1 Tax=Parnassius mnemosyne TaxID=213953 RepID=A0AAV1KVN0_9NEOP
MDVETATRAVFMLQEGESQRSVARRLGVSRRAICNAWERFLATDSVARRSGSGRARATTVQEDQYIRLSARRERTIPARVLQNRLRQSSGIRISDQTIRNRLHEDGQRSRSRVIRLKLTRPHHAARFRFAREHAEWTMDNWRNVLFTDESKVKFFSDCRRVRMWRREGERFSEPCIHETDRCKTELVILKKAQ